MNIRTYITKENTIQSSHPYTNVGRSHICQLYYGGDEPSISRHLLYFDIDRLRQLYNDGTFCDISFLSHKLVMFNTSSLDDRLLGQNFHEKQRTSSFDLELYKLDQYWDEGVGFDYGDECFSMGQIDSSTNPSNWIYGTTNVPWSSGTGSHTGVTSAITSQHFDQGNENISMDITSVINDMITGDTTTAINYGFGLKFSDIYEQFSTGQLQYVGMFTCNTDTYFQPYIESSYNNHIKDDRLSFYLDKPNKLFLYSNLGYQPTNLNYSPNVEIYDNNDILILSGTSKNITKGVYSFDINIPSSAYTQDFMFSDKWTNISINGISRPDIKMNFVLKDDTKYYNIGDNDGLPKNYGFSVSGIKAGERIISGDIRKLLVSSRVPYTVNHQEIIDGLYYRLYIKQGQTEVTVIDFDEVERTFNHNYFLIDTFSLIPNTYYIDLKLISNQEVRTIKGVLFFDIVSEV